MARSRDICVPHTKGVDEVGVVPTTYVVSSPKFLQEVKCPVPGFPAVAYSAGRLRKHFMYCHFRYKVVLVQYGKDPLPICDLCVMHMPVGRLKMHRKTSCCNKNTQMRWRRRDVAIAAKCSGATFSLTGEEEAERIEGVEVFKCLEILLDRSDKYCPAVLRNIRKAR